MKSISVSTGALNRRQPSTRPARPDEESSQRRFYRACDVCSVCVHVRRYMALIVVLSAANMPSITAENSLGFRKSGLVQDHSDRLERLAVHFLEMILEKQRTLQVFCTVCFPLVAFLDHVMNPAQHRPQRTPQ